MAIGLGDVKKHKENRERDLSVEKKRSLRPWEAEDNLGIQTRTIRAQEAVRKSRAIVDRNEEFSKFIKEGNCNLRQEEELNTTIQKRNSEFNFMDSDMPHEILKIKSKNKLSNFLRDILSI